MSLWDWLKVIKGRSFETIELKARVLKFSLGMMAMKDGGNCCVR